MFQYFLNPFVLLGLAGIALPVVAHLLSRRRFDVVEWGAMQFLNPSRKTRRRLKLEELLLLLLRIGLVCVIVLAVTRPWIPGGWLSGYRSSGSRTVVLVVDGSNTMSRSDGATSLHQQAIRRAADFLKTLGGDDTVAVVDARDQPSAVIESPLRDVRAVEDQLRKLPPPGGAGNMTAAVEKAVAILGRSSAAAREIVVFTDRQAIGWKSGDDALWGRMDDLLKFPAVRPRVWVVDVAPHLPGIAKNVSVGRIELSRELTVPDFPLRLQVTVRNNSNTELQVPIRLMLDGQALAGESQSPLIPANSETTLEFDHAIRTDGTHVLSVEADAKDDAILADNTSHAVVRVAAALPVLLVNGTPSATQEGRDTFFADLTFAPVEGRPPWVKARVVEAESLQPEDFDGVAAAVFCNVPAISADAALALKSFVARGNGAIIASGPQLTTESFKACFVDSGLMPGLMIQRTREAPPAVDQAVHVAPLSIQPGWLDRFRSDPGRSFLKAAFRAWTLVEIADASPVDPAGEASDSTIDVSGEVHPVATRPVILASLGTGDPLLLESRCGDGFVLLITSTLDRTWNDLPTRSDFVPFLYEAVFHVASARGRRNVSFGEPLIAQSANVTQAAGADSSSATEPTTKAPVQDSVTTFDFTLPGDQVVSVDGKPDGSRVTGLLSKTQTPGIYRVVVNSDERPAESDAFVVNYDHSEDDLTQLTPDDKARLLTGDRLRFSDSLDDLKQRMYGQESVTELWAALLTLFLLFLVAELLLTRRAIRRGYGGEERVVSAAA